MHIHFSLLQIQVRGLTVAGASLYSVSTWKGGGGTGLSLLRNKIYECALLDHTSVDCSVNP